MSPLFWNSIIARIYCVLICAILSSVFVWRLLFQEPSTSNIFYHTNNVQKYCWLLNERMKSLVRLSLIPETCDQITSFRSQYLTPLFISCSRGIPDYAILLCFLSGCVTIVFGILRLGFLVEFVSIPVVSGFTSAASLIIACSQIKSLLGIKIHGESFVEIWLELANNIHRTRIPDLILSCCCILILLTLKVIHHERYRSAKLVLMRREYVRIRKKGKKKDRKLSEKKETTYVIFFFFLYFPLVSETQGYQSLEWNFKKIDLVRGNWQECSCGDFVRCRIVRVRKSRRSAFRSYRQYRCRPTHYRTTIFLDHCWKSNRNFRWNMQKLGFRYSDRSIDLDHRKRSHCESIL